MLLLSPVFVRFNSMQKWYCLIPAQGKNIVFKYSLILYVIVNLRIESLQFIKHTLVYNWWQIRKTAIVAEISSTAVYCILSVCVTLSMP